MRRVTAGVVVAVAVLGAGCGRDGTATERALRKTAAELGKVHSGEVIARLAAVTAKAPDRPVGFEMRGPFALAEPGALPRGRLDYTQLSGTDKSTVTYIGTGDRAFVQVEGTAYELAGEQLDALRRPASDDAPGGLSTLRVDDWFVSPRLSDGGTVGGVATDKIEAKLDVPATLGDLQELARSFGAAGLGALPPLSVADREHLRAATDASTAIVYTGKKDRVLRRLVLHISLSGVDPSTLPAAVSSLMPVTIDLDLALARVNEPVTVETPTAVKPYSELRRR
ncbi:MAG: hypothetical protein ABR520_09395 [Mycobacteriales bacterium]|nr:hypothetical protein [Frankia sp.]